MTKKASILIILFWGIQGILYAQNIAIPDKNFLAFLKKEFSKVINNDSLILEKAKVIDGTLDCSGKNIQSIEGIQYFTSLEVLKANNNQLTSVPDISNLKDITRIELTFNNLITIPDLSNLTKLKTLFLYNNSLKSLPDLTGNTALVQLIASNNFLTVLPELNNLISLKKIDVGNNQITSIPPVDKLTLLEELTVWKNQLQALPDLQNNVNLIKVNAGTNNIVLTPDVSKNVNLQELSLDRNFLTKIPDISNLTKLKKVEFHLNQFSFEDFIPLKGYPNFQNVFIISPQKDLVVSNQNGKEFSDFIIRTGIDSSMTNNTYEWYFNGNKIETTSEDLLTIPNITDANEGKYIVKITNPSFPGMTLRTDTFLVSVSSCLDLSKLTFNISGINCLGTGSVLIKLEGENPATLSYELKSQSTSNTFKSTFGSFTGLSDESYSLKIFLDDKCQKDFPEAIKIPLEPCDETFITPNNDGDKDGFFFSETGKAVIYDKSGNKIKELSIPAEWNGTSEKGNIVAIGYYIANINNGANYIRISVLY
ncbi:leucine-rich repeat-containing protein [Sporocytophaga myxococcoides]|uniref:Leucine-rich repeat-containing protein n=1 Tax=Sporocytophaga myxococcoides TaxID=153721 RepID=A0A098LD87_9BACT|nr:leucine-rich repeat domain-containing protein [Sporocytophaga myxococcoides]GAL84382.1 leucine-rich repeat-containing protein [Sporocytophaga myxococcoides]